MDCDRLSSKQQWFYYIDRSFVLFHSIEKGSLSVINNNENNHTEDREFS